MGARKLTGLFRAVRRSPPAVTFNTDCRASALNWINRQLSTSDARAFMKSKRLARAIPNASLGIQFDGIDGNRFEASTRLNQDGALNKAQEFTEPDDEPVAP